MRDRGRDRVSPELRQMVAEASQALALLDAPRLEELADACLAFNRELTVAPSLRRMELAAEARAAVPGMAIFERVLEVTRANLQVMQRLRDLREGRLEYGHSNWVHPESIHGNH